MIELSPDEIAAACGGEVVRAGRPGRPQRAEVDTRREVAGALFFGLRGEHADGGEHAGAALERGAWGVVVRPQRARELAVSLPDGAPGWVLASPDPLASLQQLAAAWRRRLGCRTVGITGSTGKTSVKDISRAILPFRVHASPENYNTEVGLPLAICAAPPETEVLVLEMAMRGRGQIAELCEIAAPDVAAITNVGPVHLELLGTIEAIAAAKAEILAGLRDGGRAVVPAEAEALEPHLGDELTTITFGPGGDVFVLAATRAGRRTRARIGTPHGIAEFELPFDEQHNLTNTCCAVAIGVALDAPLEEMARRAPQIAFSRLRGELIELPGGKMLINDCYNANPTSMRAALDHLGSIAGARRRLAVLGEMAELGPEGPRYHREIGAHARARGVEWMLGVGELAREYAPDEWVPDPEAAVAVVADAVADGDAILVKGSRSVGLERFTDAFVARAARGG